MARKTGQRVPALLRTHPLSKERVAACQQHVPEVERYFAEGHCADFRRRVVSCSPRMQAAALARRRQRGCMRAAAC